MVAALRFYPVPGRFSCGNWECFTPPHAGSKLLPLPVLAATSSHVRVGINHKVLCGGFSKNFPLTPYLSGVCLCLLLCSRAGKGACRAPLLQRELGQSDANRNGSSVTPVFSGLAFFQCKVSALYLRRGILILFQFLHLSVLDFFQCSLELA